MSRPIWIERAWFNPENRSFINCGQVCEFRIVTRDDDDVAAVAANLPDRIGGTPIAFCEDIEDAHGVLDYLMETIEGYSHQEATRCIIWQREIRTWIEEIRELRGKDTDTKQEES